MNTTPQSPLALDDISSGGFALFRARMGFYVGLTLTLFGPGYLLMMIAQAFQLERVIAIYVALFGGRVPPMEPQSVGLTLLSLFGNAVMFGGYVVFQGAVASAALAQLRGEQLSIVDAIKQAGYAPLWMTLFDVPAFIVLVIGFACCLVPGIAIGLLLASHYPYVPSVLVAEKKPLFDAMSRSSALTEGDRGTHMLLTLLFFGLSLLFGILIWVVLGGIAFGMTSGFTTVGPGTIRSLVILWSVISVVLFPVSCSLWCWLYLARVQGYYLKTKGDPHGRADLERVFA